MKTTVFKIFLIFTISFSLIAGPYKSYISVLSYSNNHIFIIQNGLPNLLILKSLNEDNTFIENIFLKIFLLINSGNYQAGEYDILNKSLFEIHNQFIKGKTITHQITIIPGMNKYDVTELINNSSLIQDCIELSCLEPIYGFNEGMIIPDTFFYKKGMKASNILTTSSQNLVNFLQTIWIDKPETNPLKSIGEALILASIVEKEAGNDEEKGMISSVFLQRLSLGMRLQADPTIIYGLLPSFDGDIKRKDIKDKNNKFNTYVIKGLPPTSIAISSKSSIEAAILSEPGDYLYFVANKEGSHYFSKTYNEHLEAVKLYQLQ